jgi:glycosyltransferase involved in cell wall biosynthesis
MEKIIYFFINSLFLRRFVKWMLTEGSSNQLQFKRWVFRFTMMYDFVCLLRWVGFGNRRRKSVLYVGQAYYNSWYLSRALRDLGWKADVFNWDQNSKSQIYYHGEDFLNDCKSFGEVNKLFNIFFKSLWNYDLFHFANKGGLQFGEYMKFAADHFLGQSGFEILFLKALGKKIVYSSNGCLDGVSQTAFSRWGPESACSICRWQHEPTVCSDERNLAWGKFRNEVADYQCLLGGNRIDYNDDPRAHEVPEFYCLDKDLWRPDIEIPQHYVLPRADPNLIRLYHAVGNREERTRSDGANIKSTHVYMKVLDRLRACGYALELISPTGIPNREVRYLQAQADIFLEMLTYGWFGANAREAMMLGKPVICYLRPEWMESARQEIPDYVDELPIVSATPQTVEAVLRDLICNEAKRLEIGRRGREFAVKWHSAEAGARRFDQIYRELLGVKQ